MKHRGFLRQNFTFSRGDGSGGPLSEENFNNTLQQEGVFDCGSLAVTCR